MISSYYVQKIIFVGARNEIHRLKMPNMYLIKRWVNLICDISGVLYNTVFSCNYVILLSTKIRPNFRNYVRVVYCIVLSIEFNIVV